MKGNFILKKAIFRKRKTSPAFTLFISTLILFVNTSSGFSQQATARRHRSIIIENGKETSFTDDNKATITSLTAQRQAGKTFLNWQAQDQTENGFYLIYRSVNGDKYEVIGSKSGTGVTIHQPILYCYTDTLPVNGNAYYKIMHVSISHTYLLSEKISVQGNNVENTEAKNK